MEFDFLNQFHFLRPEWFTALIPLMLLVVLIRKTTAKQSGWQSVIPSHLYQHMVIGKTEMGVKPPMWMLAFVWIVSVVALAGPTWERLPQPVYQLKMGHVIVIDMSLSMRATDMTPDRLTRAKYKAIDLVNAIGEGEMGLVAYAGDAFVISPLTEDAGNITALIPSLSPEIMPVPGSDPLLGIESASELLTNAGYNSGMIYWITDGVELEQQQELQEYVASIPFTVNALTVGTSEGAPIRQQSGELLKDFTGSIVIPKLNEGAVKGVVKTSGGRFEPFTSNDDDINALATVSLLDKSDSEEDEEESNVQGDQWKEVGPYLLLVLLPFAAFAFKRGLVFIVFVGIFSPSMVQNAHALQSIGASQGAQASQSNRLATEQPLITEQPGKPDSLSWWQTPFMNDNQEALNSYQRGKYEDAVNQFSDDAWKASSLYKSGDYESALDAFKNIPGPESFYNQGNALAKLGKLEEAIEKYEQALNEVPDFEDAKVNKKIVEDLLKQQQEQNQEPNQDENGDDSDQSNSQENAENNQQQSGEQRNQDGSNEQDSQQNDNEGQQSDQSPNDDQQNGGDNSQQSDDSQMSDTNEPSDSQQQNTEQEQSEQSDSAQQNGIQKQEDEQQEQQEAQAVQGQEAELTDAEKEELQRMESLMRRVPDDPAFLLKRKMQLEAQKRQRQRMPSNRSDW
ncbi:VWA domain-containing protein [Alteromonas gracilis]|uniref:vWA domain-containing protein n=1 Tax=Alteromonas gracilis TaxID=1479524 RepID=UPI003735964F